MAGTTVEENENAGVGLGLAQRWRPTRGQCPAKCGDAGDDPGGVQRSRDIAHVSEPRLPDHQRVRRIDGPDGRDRGADRHREKGC